MDTEVIEDPKEEALPVEEAKEEAKPEKKAAAEDDGIDVTQAKNLYKALSDPKTAKPIIEALARQSGLLGDEPTKAQTKEVKKTIQAVFKEALGDKLGFLAEELGPAIEAVLKHYGEEQDSKLAAITRREVENETARAVEDLYKSHKDFEKYESRVLELMDEIAPGPNTKTSAYMEKLYRIAKSEAEEASTSEKMKAKLKKSSEDAPGRLSSASDREAATKAAPKANMTIEEALQKAALELEEK